ncbi:GNAT family N-acetyltransferase [Halorhodospira neutriphila]|uniref:GNAT family N-acetyltransferase n=1 Tax=Halorhodospira neutriphila TaxID=168379 RepID=A0ABS1E347_9GAMM|nr:GNAT family N-acetyltransferase [Halorhodospira neutriphila]MBK1726201.1 GNAT family N-acetyltransferase [Halorhodospira neutriphila]
MSDIVSDHYSLRRAGSSDYEAILEVMAHWNMHHVPSPEMGSVDPSYFFVAEREGVVIGAAGYQIISPAQGKTTLLGVIPDFSGLGVGKELQEARLEAMYAAGVREVITNADRPEVIVWYKKHYGYREIGHTRKLAPFSLESVEHWTTLELDLERYMRSRSISREQRQRYIDRHDPPPLSNYPPLVINACLTGMVPTRMRTPHVPVSPEEIIADAVQVFEAGARVVHLHARDSEGYPTPDARVYERIIPALRRECPGIVCCVTTSGRHWSDFDRRSEVLELEGDAKPDMASLTLGSLNFNTGASVNTIDMIERLAMRMLERGIKPELEAFDLGMVNLAKYLERNGVIQGRKYFNLLLGNLNTAPATLTNLATLSGALPDDSAWAAAGLGQFQLPMNMAAIVAGGHVRVGLEDTIHYDYGKRHLATNRALVDRVGRVASEIQRPLAEPSETRQILGLPVEEC